MRLRDFIRKVEETPTRKIPRLVTESYVRAFRPFVKPCLYMSLVAALIYGFGALAELTLREKAEIDVNSTHVALTTTSFFAGQNFNPDYLMRIDLTVQDTESSVDGELTPTQLQRNEDIKNLRALLDEGGDQLDYSLPTQYSLLILDDDMDGRITTDRRGLLNEGDYLHIMAGEKIFQYSSFTNYPEIIRKVDALYGPTLDAALARK